MSLRTILMGAAGVAAPAPPAGGGQGYTSQPPNGNVRVKQSAIDAGCILYLMPGVADTLTSVRDYAAGVTGTINNGRDTARTTAAFVSTATGKAIQFHPSGAGGAFGSIGYPASLLASSDDVTAYWAGRTDNNIENGLMFSRGWDGAGNGWSLQLSIGNFGSGTNGKRVRASYVDNPTTAQYDATIDLATPWVNGDYFVAALRKSGNTVDVFFGPTRQMASRTGGNGGMRDSTAGLTVAASSVNSYWPKNMGGHQRTEALSVFRGYHATATVWSRIDNIYQDLEAIPS